MKSILPGGLVACAALVFLVSSPARAQTPFSVEVRGGIGPTSGSGYATSNEVSYGAILDVPVSIAPEVQLLLGADAEQVGVGAERVLVACGNCLSGGTYVPQFTYTAAAVGIRTMSVLGDLRFRAEYGSVKVRGGRTHPGASATLDAGFPSTHLLQVVVGGRALRFTLPGTTVYTYQFSLGLRL